MMAIPRSLLMLAVAAEATPMLGQNVVALSGGVSAANGMLALLQPIVLARSERGATPEDGPAAPAAQPPMERFLGRCVGAALLGWAGSALCAVAVGTEYLFCQLNALPMALLTHTLGTKAGPLSLQFHAQARDALRGPASPLSRVRAVYARARRLSLTAPAAATGMPHGAVRPRWRARGGRRRISAHARAGRRTEGPRAAGHVDGPAQNSSVPPEQHATLHGVTGRVYALPAGASDPSLRDRAEHLTDLLTRGAPPPAVSV